MKPVAPPVKPAKAVPQGAGEVRLIGGQWKRSKLKVLNLPGLRPTPDRVRETLFNWLGQQLDGWHCVDAFAGTGALGFEAGSRGAASVLLLEQDPAMVAALEQARLRLKAHSLQVRRGDGLSALEHLSPGSVDLIFLDPPYTSGQYPRALAAAARALRPQGFIYLEAAQAWDDAALAAFGLKRGCYLKAGAVHAHLLQHAQHTA